MTTTNQRAVEELAEVAQFVQWLTETVVADGVYSDIGAAHVERVRNFRDRVDEMLATRTSGWRPISEAPRDGTDVLVYVRGETLYPTAAHYDTPEYFEKEYGDREYMEEGWRWSFGYPTDFHEETIEPTHFMPLPPPPGK
jgi:hypothetical protein